MVLHDGVIVQKTLLPLGRKTVLSAADLLIFLQILVWDLKKKKKTALNKLLFTSISKNVDGFKNRPTNCHFSILY